MAFNSRKFQKLIEEEKKNNAEFVDEFEDDFADDFDNEEDIAEALENEEPAVLTEFVPIPEELNYITEEAEEEPEEQPMEEKADEEPAKESAEEPAEEIAEEQPAEEAEAQPEVIALPAPEAKAEANNYNPQEMWKDMAALAVNAKECINAGAFFRANDIVSAMRGILVEMMCRANGITERFNENVDYLSDECKQDIYTSYPSTLSKQALSDVVTHIMAVTYKYI